MLVCSAWKRRNQWSGSEILSSEDFSRIVLVAAFNCINKLDFNNKNIKTGTRVVKGQWHVMLEEFVIKSTLKRRFSRRLLALARKSQLFLEVLKEHLKHVVCLLTNDVFPFRFFSTIIFFFLMRSQKASLRYLKCFIFYSTSSCVQSVIQRQRVKNFFLLHFWRLQRKIVNSIRDVAFV